MLNRRASRDLTVWVVPVLATVMVFFAFVLVFVSSPFATQVAPADGRGLNPSLQNPYMISHPIFLYLGYVGLTIPFAFAIGSLLARRTDERWIVATRRATLVAWTALGIGRTVGSKWAYEEVGWGVTQSPIGAWFLGFLTLVVVGSLALVVARLPLLRMRQARVARLPGGELPLQQPAPRRADADDPLGRRVPDRPRGGRR